VFAHPARQTIAHEHSPTGPVRALRGGYAQSKWVAEGLVRLAGRRGLPTVTYRPSRLSGDRRTGACQADDLLWRVLAGCVAAKAAPGDVTASYDVVPVDVAAAAIAVLSRTESPGGQVYHLTNTRRLGFGTAVGYLRELGYPLENLSLDTWAALVRSDPANPANPVLDIFLAEMTGGGWSDLVLDNTRTAHALAAAGLHSPEIGYDLFAANAGFFVRTGFLPGPGDLRP
jgi:thioester reductase-like protein